MGRILKILVNIRGAFQKLCMVMNEQSNYRPTQLYTLYECSQASTDPTKHVASLWAI